MQDLVIISIPSFVIALRETIEAALIVGIVQAYLIKTKNDQLTKNVWFGAIFGIVASIIGAIAFLLAYGGFTGTQGKLFEGMIMVIAVIVLTTMILWNFKHSKQIKVHLEYKVQSVISGNKRFAIFSLIFIAVLREGIETVLFLGSIASSDTPVAVFTGAILGIIIAVFLAYGLFHGSINLNLKNFFTVTSVILILFAAGLFSHAIHEFQELLWFGPYEVSNAPFWNIPLLDISTILPDNVGLGAILRALIGYQDKPTLVELIAYIGYIIIAIILYLRIKVDSTTNDHAIPTP